jgi:hypothetical protein
MTVLAGTGIRYTRRQLETARLVGGSAAAKSPLRQMINSILSYFWNTDTVAGTAAAASGIFLLRKSALNDGPSSCRERSLPIGLTIRNRYSIPHARNTFL